MGDKSTDLVAATAEATPPEKRTIADWLVTQEDKIGQQLGGQIDVGRFMQAVISSFRATPQLQSCSATSILGSVMLAAQLRLEVGPALGQFYLTPRNITTEAGGREWVCVPIIGYRGYTTLAYRSGLVEKVEALLVRKGDTFERWADSDKGRQYRWSPLDDDNTRDITHVIGSAKIVNAGTVWECLTIDEVTARRPRHKTPIWDSNFEAMVRKTALRALSPYMPMTAELNAALASDERRVEAIDGVDQLHVADDTVEENENGENE